MRSLRRNLNSRHFKNWQGDSQYTAYNSVPGCKLPLCYPSSAYLPDHVFSLNSPHFGKFHGYHTLYTTDPQTNFINKGIRSFAFKVLHAPFNCFLPFQPSFFFKKEKLYLLRKNGWDTGCVWSNFQWTQIIMRETDKSKKDIEGMPPWALIQS